MDNIKRYTFITSRTGEIVPVLGTQPLHSTVDPQKEAQRLVSAIENNSFIIFLGLGGGFAPLAALENTNARVTVIDFNKNSITELLESKDYSKLLNNSRFNLLIDPTNQEIKNFLMENFKPALYSGIKTIPLRTRIEQDNKVFAEAFDSIQETIDLISKDYSVQAHFGIRWFSNIIRNIKNINANNESFRAKIINPSIQKAAIAAAGPSLDHQISSLIKLKKQNVFLISTDTALNALLYNNITPDAVVSIDCQHISYYHFLTSGNNYNNLKNIPLILDIASPPMLYNMSAFPVFFSSGHPLALYAGVNMQTLPFLDTSGGNVTYACLSFAEYLGVKEITLFGADFSYVNSQSYARGTYIYPYFHKKQNRLLPIEAQFSSFLYRSPFLPPEDSKKNSYYETSSLRFYRQRLEEKANTMNAKIICEKGYGAPVNLNKEPKKLNTEQKINSQDKDTIISGKEFLEQYRNDIISLPDNEEKLNEKQKQVFTTLLPFAAAVKKRNSALQQEDLIEEVKRLSIKEIERVL